jgi:chromosome segregation protein
MKLLRLEMKGFKSFARETVLHFNEQITGVVGPNGSGKSNVVDAIRWVLGEQKTSELRLDKMGDVLFNGTKKRKSAPVARVSITFDNDKGVIQSEYSELTITRMLYRSGESEYRLNDVACRLKDIRSDLMDTGIGSNSYAIIALGMVDDILSDKDQARLKMFEQAAGISKFKTRKRETLNKLKLATADLERVDDLLHEIQSNLRQLKKQAKKAEKYLAIKDQYKILSIDFAIIQSAQSRAEFKSLKEQISGAQDDLEKLSAQVNTLESEIQERKRLNLSNESSVSQNQKDLSEIIQEIRSIENKREMRKQSIDFAAQSIQRLKQQIKTQKDQLEELHVTTQKLSKRVEVEKQELSSKREAVEAINKLKKERQDAFSKIESGRSKKLEILQKWQKEKMQWEQKSALNESRRQDIKRNLTQLIERSKDQSNRKKELESTFADAEKRLSQIENQRHQYEISEQERQQHLEELEIEKKQVDEQLHTVQRRYDAEENEFKLLKSLVDKLEGFPESAKFLTKSNRWNKQAALFSDILLCKSPYRAALENFLESYLSYFVVNSPEDAVDGIRLLRESQKGKANFMVNQWSAGMEKTSTDIPYATAALEVVEMDPRYNALIRDLLHDVHFVEKENTARALSQKHPNSTFILIDGSIIYHKHTISGGSSDLFEGKRLGRKKNLEKLEKQIKKTADELDEYKIKQSELEHRMRQLREQKNNHLARELQEKWTQAQQNHQKANFKLENISDTINQLDQEKNELSSEQKKLENQSNEIKNQLEILSEKGESLQEKVESVDATYQEHAKSFSELSEQLNEAQIQLIRHENLVEQIAKERSYKQSRITELRQQLSENQQELKHLQEERSQNIKLQESDQNLLSKLYQRKEQKSESLSDIESKYFQARNHIAELEKKVSNLNNSQRQKQELLYNFKEKLSEVKMKLHGISERLNVEFNISLNQVVNQSPSQEWEVNPLAREIEKIKAKLQGFGDVNPMAVETYNEMKERHDLMDGQKQDILQAQKKLITTIDEIESTATRQFMEAFEKIRTNFIDVFRTLFTESDTADLVLLDPDTPLESAIEIIAKPKGKRPLSLSQLSGGEKTLTATALLFALYLLKPAPFCVFDEVDAPLDDANIEKFNRIIHRFSEQSQFVIVTHNKSTMAAVDIIYGVYMNEPGVSGLSPVDFRKLEHTSVMDTLSSK